VFFAVIYDVVPLLAAPSLLLFFLLLEARLLGHFALASFFPSGSGAPIWAPHPPPPSDGVSSLCPHVAFVPSPVFRPAFCSRFLSSLFSWAAVYFNYLTSWYSTRLFFSDSSSCPVGAGSAYLAGLPCTRNQILFVRSILRRACCCLSFPCEFSRLRVLALCYQP